MNKVLAGAFAGLALGAFSAATAVEIGDVTLDMSAGNGLFFASDFGGGVAGIEGKYRGDDVSLSAPWAGGGIRLFFDATYAEIGLNITGGGGKGKLVVSDDEMDDNFTLGFAGLGISVLGKYPFAVTEKITLFPAAGIEYMMALAAIGYFSVDEGRYGYNGGLDLWDGKNDDPKAGDFSALWFKFGGGADFFISESVFIRPEILYGIRLANKIEKDGAADVIGISLADTSPILGHGLTFSASMGYKF